MAWKITYYSEAVESFIGGLPSGLFARYLRLVDIMLEFGPHLGMPHTRSLGGGLFELRIKGKEGIARMFYFTMEDQQIVMLHGFVKKSQKTPLKELRIARERLAEVKKS